MKQIHYNPSSDAGNNCKIISHANATLAADWENIPETFILNAAIGLVLYLAFVWLTYLAWRRTESSDILVNQNIVSFLYGYRDPELWYVIPRFELLRREERHHKHDMQYPHIYLPPRIVSVANGQESSSFLPSILNDEQLQASYLSRKLNTFFGWFFSATDADIIYTRGIDAYEYLLFQRHLIFIMFVTSVLCLGVILPIHWIAGTSADPKVIITTSFQRSTIKNIASNSHLHWAHIICSGMIVLVTLKVMGSYMHSIMSQEEVQVSQRTLLVGNIPADRRSRLSLSLAFQEYFPGNIVEAIQFLYDTRTLADNERYLSSAVQAKLYCQAYKQRHDSEILAHHACCCCWVRENSEPGTIYYANEEETLRKKINELCHKLVREPTEYAFVTFKSQKHAWRVLSGISKMKSPVVWSVRYAPHPDNVEYDDLLNLARISKYKVFMLHVLMIIIFIFITTPNVVLSMIERLSVLRPEKAVQLTGFQGLMINYISILLQIITTAILPALITLISRQIPYEDSSAKGHSVMWKVYSFLILMVIVMPSIGMSSAQALFETDIDPKCLFPTDNGAYYINYVISSIFLSTVLELIKPVDIIYYYFTLWTSRSSAEVERGRQQIDREFSVGMQHTGVLLIFSVAMTYSISCPIIAPVGLVYLCIKHAVDHYNLYYTYFTKKVDKDLQSTIVIFVKVALLLMLFQTTVAIYINTGTSYFSLLTQMIFWITLAALVFNCFFDCTSRAIPNTKPARYHNEFCACYYLPKVISNLLRLDAIPSECISRKV